MAKYYIYADESCVSDNYMLYGGSSIKTSDLKYIYKKFEEARKNTGMTKELKWSKVKRQKYNEYKYFVDIYFQLLRNKQMVYRAMIIEKSKVNHKKFNDNDAEIGFYKFYYYFLLHGFAEDFIFYHEFDSEANFIVNLDKRNTKYKLSDLETILNNGFNKLSVKYSFEDVNYLFFENTAPFLKVEGVDSKKHDILQITDIITGAIGYQINNKDKKPNAAKAKIDLANYIASKIRITRFERRSYHRGFKFNVWNFRLQQ